MLYVAFHSCHINTDRLSVLKEHDNIILGVYQNLFVLLLKYLKMHCNIVIAFLIKQHATNSHMFFWSSTRLKHRLFLFYL